MFDNREPLGRPIPRLTRHFLLEVGGRRIAFCYIRKNATNSFKELAAALSPHRERLAESPNTYQFLRSFHGASPEDVAASANVVLTMRHPLDRMISVYRNKFVQRVGNEQLFKSYARATGRDPDDASFTDLVLRYATLPVSELDPHLVPQTGHLLPVVYTDAIPLACLHSRMSKLLGPVLADRFFALRRNSSTAAEDHASEPAVAVTSADLHVRFKATGRLPPASAFVSPSIEAAVADIYAADLVLFERVVSVNGRAV